jgi:hypothetical protein
LTDLPAQHYLQIYRTRLRMAEEGVTHPSPKVVAAIKRLIVGLETATPETAIRLEILSDKALFTTAVTGDFVGEMELAPSDA